MTQKNVIILRYVDGEGLGDIGRDQASAAREEVRSAVEKAFRQAGRDDIIVAIPADVVIETCYAPPDLNAWQFGAVASPSSITPAHIPGGVDLTPQIFYGTGRDTVPLGIPGE